MELSILRRYQEFCLSKLTEQEAGCGWCSEDSCYRHDWKVTSHSKPCKKFLHLQ